MSVRDEIAEVSRKSYRFAPWGVDAHVVIADAIVARFPYITADQSLYDYAASLRQQLLDTRAELEKEKTQQTTEQAEEQERRVTISRAFRDPYAYQGEPVCPCCGSGWPACPEVQRHMNLSFEVAHRIACERYQWTDDLCSKCEQMYETEDAR